MVLFRHDPVKSGWPILEEKHPEANIGWIGGFGGIEPLVLEGKSHVLFVCCWRGLCFCVLESVFVCLFSLLVFVLLLCLFVVASCFD